MLEQKYDTMQARSPSSSARAPAVSPLSFQSRNIWVVPSVPLSWVRADFL